jgi:hypothetical protein
MQGGSRREDWMVDYHWTGGDLPTFVTRRGQPQGTRRLHRPSAVRHYDYTAMCILHTTKKLFDLWVNGSISARLNWSRVSASCLALGNPIADGARSYNAKDYRRHNPRDVQQRPGVHYV